MKPWRSPTRRAPISCSAGKSRSAQLIAGAAAARSDWLLFLHPETALEPGWEVEVESFIAQAHAGAAARGGVPFRAGRFRRRGAPRRSQGESARLAAGAALWRSGPADPQTALQEAGRLSRPGRRWKMPIWCAASAGGGWCACAPAPSTRPSRIAAPGADWRCRLLHALRIPSSVLAKL